MAVVAESDSAEAKESCSAVVRSSVDSEEEECLLWVFNRSMWYSQCSQSVKKQSNFHKILGGNEQTLVIIQTTRRMATQRSLSEDKEKGMKMDSESLLNEVKKEGGPKDGWQITLEACRPHKNQLIFIPHPRRCTMFLELMYSTLCCCLWIPNSQLVCFRLAQFTPKPIQRTR